MKTISRLLFLFLFGCLALPLLSGGEKSVSAETPAPTAAEQADGVNVKNYNGWTPLHSAVREDNVEAVKFLVSQGADVNAKNYLDDTPLHLAQNLEIAKFLISRGAEVNAKDNEGKTPLHWAAGSDAYNNIEVVKYLVSQGADVNAKTNYGETPLHWAAGSDAYNNIEVVKYLVSQGADVNAKNDHGETPLHGAAGNNFNGNIKGTVEILVANGADVNAKDNEGKTPLHWVVEPAHGWDGEGRVELAKYLVSQGADVNVEDNEGKTPLHWAVEPEHGRVSVIREADVNVEPAHNEFLVELVKCLVSQGADVNVEDNKGRTPLHWVAMLCPSENSGFVYFGNLKLVNIEDEEDEEDEGCEGGYWSSAWGDWYCERIETTALVQYLVSQGADVTAKDNEGKTPLHWAALGHDGESFKFLFADFLQGFREGGMNWGGMVRTSLFDRLDVKYNKGKVLDDEGNILHDFTKWWGNVEAVQYLVSQGADVNVKDNDGKTPLDWARENGKEEIAEYLSGIK